MSAAVQGDVEVALHGAPVPINRAEGDFPSDRPTTFTDGYNRSQVLVPIEDLHRETAEVQRWRSDISAALGVRPGELNLTLAGAVEKIGDLRRDSEARARERARAFDFDGYMTGREARQLRDEARQASATADRLAVECDRLTNEARSAQARVAELERRWAYPPSTNYRGLLDQIAKVIEVDGEEQGGYHYADLPKMVQEYGSDCNHAGQSLAARHAQDDIDRLTAERDAEQAISAAQRQSYAHLSAEFATALTQLRETRDLTVWLTDEIGENADGATLIDLVRRYAGERVGEVPTVAQHATVGPDQALPAAEKVRTAANVVAEYEQRHGASCASSGDLHAEAERLESEAATGDLVAVSSVIEQAIRKHASAPWLQLPGPVDLIPGIARAVDCALDAAGLLRGEGR